MRKASTMTPSSRRTVECEREKKELYRIYSFHREVSQYPVLLSKSDLKNSKDKHIYFARI
jgi:hypothetical protein